MDARRFIRNLILFMALVYGLDLGFSALLESVRPADNTAFIVSKQDFEEMDKVDWLFIGDSHTADGIVPEEFEDQLGGTAYNYGLYHLSPIEGYYLLKDLLARHQELPRAVVLGTSPIMFTRALTEGRYTPSFLDDPLTLVSLLLSAGSDNLSVFTFAGRKLYLFEVLLKRAGGEGPADLDRIITRTHHGYLYNSRHYKELENLNCHPEVHDRDTVAGQVDYFRITLDLLRERGIAIFFANPPVHQHFYDCVKETRSFGEFHGLLEKIAAEYQVPVFNSWHRSMTDFPGEYFVDGDHLCYPGAREFSRSLAAFISRNMPNP